MYPECVCVIIAANAVLHNICVKKRTPIPRQQEVVLETDDNPLAPVIGGRLVHTHIINNL